MQTRTPRRASVTCPLYRLATILLLAAVIPTASAGAQGEGTLRNRIGAGKAQERSLSSAAARLGALERKTSREIAILQGRLAAAQAAASKAEIQLADTQTRLDAARKRANRLRKRLAEVRGRLAGLLRSRYMDDQPDFVTVVLHANGFQQLLKYFPTAERADDAQFFIGESLGNMNRLPEAIDAYNQVIQNYPNGDQVDMAYYRRGFVESQMGRTDAARATWEEVVKRYPDSQGAQLARQRLAGLKTPAAPAKP